MTEPELTVCRGCRGRFWSEESPYCRWCRESQRWVEEDETCDWDALLRGEELVFDDGCPNEEGGACS